LFDGSKEVVMAVLILRDSSRGTGTAAYGTGDVIATAEDADTVDMPPTVPFLVLKVTGVEKSLVDQYMADSTTARKTWFIDTSRMTEAQRTYLTTRRHLGFLADLEKYGQEVADDVTVMAADARKWLVNKSTGRDANGQKI
jgi:hypothetical protein